MVKKINPTALFYGLIGVVSSFFLFIIFYWSLRLNSSIASLIDNTFSEPLYFWPYVILTFGIIALFGVNISLLVYRWRRFGRPRFRTQAGGSLGSLVGIAASACPVCGSLILSIIGITGGLAVFPLQGLELKTLSFGLMALPIFLTTRELKRLDCKDDSCPSPHDAGFSEKDNTWMVRLVVLLIFFGLVGWSMLKTDPVLAKFLNTNTSYAVDSSTSDYKLYYEVLEKVVPEKGFQSKISLKDSAVKLTGNGVIDRDKFESLYKDRGGFPVGLTDVLNNSKDKPILLTRHNANIYLNILWPLGLANYMVENRESPVVGSSLFNFASTGGWTLGKEENGGAYFNKFPIVQLTPEQETLVVTVAKNTYRPCCDNSTFFQDCNHGSALLGLLQLGASQGLTEEELFKEALYFNSFWFPDSYIQTALYFKVVKNTDWEDVDPKIIMGYSYSAISQWIKNVQIEVAKMKNLIPEAKGGGGCGV